MIKRFITWLGLGSGRRILEQRKAEHQRLNPCTCAVGSLPYKLYTHSTECAQWTPHDPTKIMMEFANTANEDGSPVFPREIIIID